jgi:hypothetical protein
MPGIEMDDSAAYGARYAHCVNIWERFSILAKGSQIHYIYQ